MTKEHTPTPWVHNGTWVQDGMDILTETGVQIATTSLAGFISGVSDEANAAHIVKCVNMHDELVLTLKGLLDAYSKPDQQICCNGRECGCYGATIYQQAEHYARETLKKAGAL